MKVGDKVRIKSIDWYNQNKRNDGIVSFGQLVTFIPEMSQYCGKEATIVECTTQNTYKLNIDASYYSWIPEMFEHSKALIIPEGYTIDKIEGNKILLKEILPKTWEGCMEQLKVGEYISNAAEISPAVPSKPITIDDQNIFPEGLGKPMLALMQLLVCREIYRQGWKPNWVDRSEKYTIYFKDNTAKFSIGINNARVLAFQSVEIRDEFYKNFKNLIEEAKDLI